MDDPYADKFSNVNTLNLAEQELTAHWLEWILKILADHGSVRVVNCASVSLLKLGAEIAGNVKK